MNIAKVELVRNLLQKTEARGCTKDEADSARRMAEKIAAQFSIDLNAAQKSIDQVTGKRGTATWQEIYLLATGAMSAPNFDASYRSAFTERRTAEYQAWYANYMAKKEGRVPPNPTYSAPFRSARRTARPTSRPRPSCCSAFG